MPNQSLSINALRMTRFILIFDYRKRRRRSSGEGIGFFFGKHVTRGLNGRLGGIVFLFGKNTFPRGDDREIMLPSPKNVGGGGYDPFPGLRRRRLR